MKPILKIFFLLGSIHLLDLKISFWIATQMHHFYFVKSILMWDKVFKNGPSKICERQPLKNLNRYGLLWVDVIPSNFLKAVFHKFDLVYSFTLLHAMLFLWFYFLNGFITVIYVLKEFIFIYVYKCRGVKIYLEISKALSLI